MIVFAVWLVALCSVFAPSRSVREVEQILRHADLAKVRTSVAVLDLETGRMLYERNPDASMTPASNLKLLTTAAAVAGLGADYQFRTSFFAAAAPDADGRVAGDLIVLGGGDPCLRVDVLAAQGLAEPAGVLADLLLQAGVRSIGGRLVLDDSWFSGDDLHPDWDPSDHDFPYAAPVSALSMHANCLTLELAGRGPNPRARLATEASTYRVRNELSHHVKPRSFEAGALRPDGEGVVRVRGRVGKAVEDHPIRVPVRDGALFFGRCLTPQLSRRGITLDGELVQVDGALAELADPVEIVRVESALATAVLLSNKESDNAMAEHLLLTLGAVRGGAGSFEQGADAVGATLAQLTGRPLEALRLRDGSGLSAQNRITARWMVDTLSAMNRSDDPERNLYLRSLPVSGFDGSLAARLSEAPYRGAVRAKTGYISGTSALSGYARATSGRTVAFSILFNGVPSGKNWRMKELQDDICRILVDAL